jgi:hypothetical protein
MMVWGYVFGYLKAHCVYTYGQFIFDSATLGFYLALILKPPSRSVTLTAGKLKPWVVVLIFWPVFMALIPLQHYMIQLVGLRGNIMWVPMIIIGAWLDAKALVLLATTFAVLNVSALGMAFAEFTWGVEQFLPENEATDIVFKSRDVGAGVLENSYLRIPSFFTSAHSYAGTMVITVPWLLGCLTTSREVGWLGKPLYMAGLAAAVLGVFIAGPRSPVVVLGLLVFLRLVSGRISWSLVLTIAFVGYLTAFFVLQEERMQRFLSLQETEFVIERIQGSASVKFFEIVADYPMGRGMGAGGTNIPFWLLQYMNGANMLIENEYGRLVLEQGLVGLFLWLAFIFFWFQQPLDKKESLFPAKALLWANCLVWFSTMFIGVGAFISVPAAALQFLSLGFVFSGLGLGTRFSGIRNDCTEKSSPHKTTKNLPAYQRGLARA